MASVAAQSPLTVNVVYCATKVFVKYLCQGASASFSARGPKNVEIMALQPAYVDTKMIAKAKEMKIDYRAVTAILCVDGALRDLGHETTTFGPMMHDFRSSILTTAWKYGLAAL